MRLTVILAAASLVFGGAAGAGSCASPTDAAVAARDDGAPVAGAPGTEAEHLFMHECGLACMGGPRAMTAWCTLLQYHPDPKVRKGCWEHVNSSKPVCVAWCAWAFIVP